MPRIFSRVVKTTFHCLERLKKTLQHEKYIAQKLQYEERLSDLDSSQSEQNGRWKVFEGSGENVVLNHWNTRIKKTKRLNFWKKQLTAVRKKNKSNFTD